MTTALSHFVYSVYIMFMSIIRLLLQAYGYWKYNMRKYYPRFKTTEVWAVFHSQATSKMNEKNSDV